MSRVMPATRRVFKSADPLELFDGDATDAHLKFSISIRSAPLRTSPANSIVFPSGDTARVTCPNDPAENARASQQPILPADQVDRMERRVLLGSHACIDDRRSRRKKAACSDALDELPRGRRRERHHQQRLSPRSSADTAGSLRRRSHMPETRCRFASPVRPVRRRGHAPDVPAAPHALREVDPFAVARPCRHRLISGPLVIRRGVPPSASMVQMWTWPSGSSHRTRSSVHLATTWASLAIALRVGELARVRSVRRGHPDCDVPGAARDKRQPPAIRREMGIAFKRRGRRDPFGGSSRAKR